MLYDQMLYSFFFNIISGKAQGAFPSLLRSFLWICSLFFGFLVACRRLLYRIGLKKSYRLPGYTISVGNMVAGGTGKTPLTIYLAKQLSGRQVAVVLRSYKAKAICPVQLSEVNDPEVVGDEACIIARQVPEVAVWVAKKKGEAAKKAVENGAQVVIIDDGFQHLAIKSDFHIVVIDIENPYGYGYLLPRGTLRESLSGLKRADLVVLNCRQEDPTQAEKIEEKLREYTLAPIVKAVMKVTGIFDLEDAKRELEKGQKVALFCGIGKPEQFVKTAEGFGVSVVGMLAVQDHEAVGKDRLVEFANEMRERGASLLLCTEKDRVKLEGHCSLPVYWVKVEMDLLIPFLENNVLKQNNKI